MGTENKTGSSNIWAGVRLFLEGFRSIEEQMEFYSRLERNFESTKNPVASSIYEYLTKYSESSGKPLKPLIIGSGKKFRIKRATKDQPFSFTITDHIEQENKLLRRAYCVGESLIAITFVARTKNPKHPLVLDRRMSENEKAVFFEEVSKALTEFSQKEKPTKS